MTVIHGDCLEVLRGLPDQSFDALITDPPAGIAFMSRDWDKDKGGMLEWVNWLSEVMAECLRCLKPGGVGVVWSIPRTCGWTQLALELSGFRVIDSISIINGSGFPKAQDIGKGIDKHFGHEREVIGIDESRHRRLVNQTKGSVSTGGQWEHGKRDVSITAPSHPLAQQWDGWKTPALKPATETWFLVQRPCEGSIVRNILTHGVGGLNIEAARIGLDGTENLSAMQSTFASMGYQGSQSCKGVPTYKPSGRYPSNCILIHSPDCTDAGCVESCPVEIMGRQSGVLEPAGSAKKTTHKTGMFGIGQPGQIYKDTGTAARYFKQLPFDHDGFHYFTKASRRDRSVNGAVDNVHPTVKNTALMEYFAKLICPPNGHVLDPFGGSGSTALGCIKAGMSYTLIEREPEYVDIINARIAAYRQQNGLEPIKVDVPSGDDNQQLDLFAMSHPAV